jgi:CO/xanthine dehydrogenase FAD-binding subunit
MVKFEYHEPRSITEAVALAGSLPREAKWLAGGTELLPKLKQRALTTDHLINLKRIPELAGIEHNHSIVRIGSLTNLEELATSKLIARNYPAVSEAASGVASPNIRRAATIGGNLCQAPNCVYFVHRSLWRLPKCFAAQGDTCNAIPGARRCTAMSPVDTAPALIALGAELEIEGKEGKYRMPLESFFVSSGITVLRKNEMIAAIVIPEQSLQSGSAYFKYSRRKTLEYGIVSVGVRLFMESGQDRCLEAKVVLGGMGPTPVRAGQAEGVLTGERITQDIISRAADLAAQAGQPWTDLYASNQHRRYLVRVLVKNALNIAYTKAKTGK